MSATISIRPVMVEDAQILHRIINKAYRTNAGWTSEADFVADERISLHELTKLFASYGDDLILVAHDNDIVIGCIQAELWSQHPKYNLPEGSALLGLFAVDPQIQSKGVGRKLLEACIETV